MAQVNVNVVSIVNSAKELVDGFIRIGVLSADGNTWTSPNPQQDAEIATMVVDIVQRYGFDVPDKIENIIKILPLLLALSK